MALTRAEIRKRYYDRKKGISVPVIPRRRGYHQTPEHIAKRILKGPAHPNFKGENITIKTGRTRALLGYPLRPCEVCGSIKAERHHKDGNTRNNNPDNILFLCRKHHMMADGRMDQFLKNAKQNVNKDKNDSLLGR